MNFQQAIEHLRKGEKLTRAEWKEKGIFVFMQIPTTIPIEAVPKMLSMPESVKFEFKWRSQKTGMNEIRFSDQMALVYPDNSIVGFSPSLQDTLAEDWYAIP